MNRTVLFAITLSLFAICVSACARRPAQSLSATAIGIPATNPTTAQALSPVTNPTVATAPVTSPTIDQALAPASIPTTAPESVATPTTVLAPALINPVGAQVDLPANPTVDQVLDALDQTGKNMKEFTSKVSLTEGNPNFGNLKTSVGNIAFQKKGDEDGRIRVTFDKRKIGNLFHDEKIEYLLDNGLLIDRNYKKTNEDRRQIIKPGEKINLLKLGEGPFPLPIGQKKEDVHREFDVQLKPATKSDDPDLAGAIHVQLKPKPGARFARKFATIDIWVSRKNNFPVQIITVSPDDEQKITKLPDVLINPAGGLKDSDFKLPPIDEKTWGIHTEKYGE